MKVVGWPSWRLHQLLETAGCRGFIDWEWLGR